MGKIIPNYIRQHRSSQAVLILEEKVFLLLTLCNLNIRHLQLLLFEILFFSLFKVSVRNSEIVFMINNAPHPSPTAPNKIQAEYFFDFWKLLLLSAQYSKNEFNLCMALFGALSLLWMVHFYSFHCINWQSSIFHSVTISFKVQIS